MGISDLGVNANGTYKNATNSFEGTLTLNSFAAFSPTNITNISYPSPDWVLLELNAVAVNVTLPSSSDLGLAGTFWVQNGLRFNGTTFQVQDEILNYSSPYALFPTPIVSGRGGIVADLYQYDGPELPFSLPTTIHLFDNITMVNKHTVVRFGYSVDGHAGNYDNVTFSGTSTILRSQFLVNGANLTPAKRLYDAEFVLGGTGDAGNVDIVALNGTATLDWNDTTYQPVPAAFDFGVDSTDTATGVAEAYTGTTVQLTAGPSFLEGFWNTNGSTAHAIAPYAAPQWITVRIDLEPGYGFLFATNATDAAKPLAEANYSYAPTNPAGQLVTDLPRPEPGDPYNFTAWADGNRSVGWTIGSNATAPGTGPAHVLQLPASAGTLDAPVYLRGNAQALAFASAHVNNTSYVTTGRPTLGFNPSEVPLAAPFLRVNRAGYPTFTLFAAVGVNISVVINGWVQASSTFDYTDPAGNVSQLADWTEGYFFFYGKGNYTVENITIGGNQSRVEQLIPVGGPSTVEFYNTQNCRAANVSVSQAAIGVSVVR
ncbi:MAG TPA: thermopsin family protease, partial [Thermoplasmata archaeon]|nr:thermopsin family protease [Thermoplasmata archaeon]